MFKYPRFNYFSMNSNISTLVFDLGDTLYPSSLQALAISKVLDLHKIKQVDYTNYRKRYGNRHLFLGGVLNLNFVDNFLQDCTTNSEIDAITFLSDYRQILYELIQEYVREDPYGTWACLKKLSSGYQLGILSDNCIETKEMWQEILNEMNLNIFSFFIVSEEVGVRKPNLRMFFEIRMHNNNEFDEIIYFGDNIIRDGAAAFHGLKYIHVSGYSELPFQERLPYAPKATISSIDFITMENLSSLILDLSIDPILLI